MRYELVPVTKTEARAFVQAHHRHNEAPSTAQVSFAVGLEVNGELVPIEIGVRSWADDNDPNTRPRYDVTLWGERKNAANLDKLRWERML